MYVMKVRYVISVAEEGCCSSCAIHERSLSLDSAGDTEHLCGRTCGETASCIDVSQLLL
ncbi:hypothetical protein PLEOSDRAFT_1088720 [Pleurotus ostreatus PC15]|uniref:Uncharacterized protein n=1 Tax=Pleurotus ostreatus (strain PC15) TaxID=1137138 RepID=A0A067NWA6_PLEO1|nr:hypothetical protein PLEOSDRAFT_1088720 [Pleurotus ostreatus PC15]